MDERIGRDYCVKVIATVKATKYELLPVVTALNDNC